MAIETWDNTFKEEFYEEIKTLNYIKSIIKKNSTKEAAKKMVDDFLKYLKETCVFDEDSYNVIKEVSKEMIKKFNEIEKFNVTSKFLAAYEKYEEKETKKFNKEYSYGTSSSSEYDYCGGKGC